MINKSIFTQQGEGNLLSHRSLATILVLAALFSLLAAFSPASAAGPVFIDFEQYAPGTSLAQINEPGVTFQTGSGMLATGVGAGGPSGNFLALVGLPPSFSLTVATNPSASFISFDYLAMPWQTTTATFYLHGSVVHTAVLSSPIVLTAASATGFESFAYEGFFDTLVINFELLRNRRDGPQAVEAPVGILLDNLALTLSGTSSPAPDDRLNWGYCDLKAAIYQRTGPDGGPALHVYGIDGESNGHFLLDVTGPDLAPYIASPPQGQNVLIEEAGHVQLYALISGEFSLHIHMDDQGNVCAWVFDGLPPANTHVVNYNMYQ